MFGSNQSRRNYSNHGFSTSLLIFGYALYMFFASPASLDKLKTVSGTLVNCDVHRHTGRHSQSSHVAIYIQSETGEQLGFKLDPSPWPLSESCAFLNQFISNQVEIYHSANPDPLSYLYFDFRDVIWQMQRGNQVVIDYSSQVSHWKKQSRWMAKFMGGFGVLMFILALFEKRRGAIT